eukprot:4376757-Amphidinium_carterae.1
MVSLLLRPAKAMVESSMSPLDAGASVRGSPHPSGVHTCLKRGWYQHWVRVGYLMLAVAAYYHMNDNPQQFRFVRLPDAMPEDLSNLHLNVNSDHERCSVEQHLCTCGC